MIMFILNYLLVNKKKATIITFLIVAFHCLLISVACSETIVVDAVNSTGEWNQGIVTFREVAFTNKPLIKSEIRLHIGDTGKYQLFAYVHHNWRKSVPCIYVEAIDAKGIKHEGYHRIENIWYLKKDQPGRWFMVSLVQNPYWELPSGNLTISFWADAEKAVWDNNKSVMEDQIAIDKFFIVPIEESGTGIYLSNMISPEVGDGGWDVIDYYNKYATNLIKTIKKGGSLSLVLHIPRQGYYKLGCSAFSLSDSDLKLIVERRTNRQRLNIRIKGSDVWSFVCSSPVNLEKDEYRLTLINPDKAEILVDYLFLLSYAKQ